MRFKARLSVGGLALAAATIALAGTASASTTVGSNLSGTPNLGFTCGELCTNVLNDLDASLQAPGGLFAPADGVVVNWSVKIGPTNTVPTRLRIVRATGTGGYTGAGTSQFQTPALGGVSTFPTRLPVKRGDLIGIDANGLLDVYRAVEASHSAKYLVFLPALVDGAAARAPFIQDPYELMIQAEIEPDGDGDGFGDETQDGCPTDARSSSPCDSDADGVTDGSDKCPQVAGPATTSGCPVPETSLTDRPRAKTRERKAVFSFTSDRPNATFECSLDGAPFDPCASPRKVKVKRGRHTFRVRASANGVTDPTPAKVRWKVKPKRR